MNQYRNTPRGTASKRPTSSKPKPQTGTKMPRGEKDKEPVEVFCRIRPLRTLADVVCVYKMTNSIVTIKSPSVSKDDCSYAFKHVFTEDVGQKELFNHVALPMVEDLLNAKDGLLFTYGITSSGKTHTITGNPQDCGVMPRTLDVVFNSIQDNKVRKFIFKPDGMNLFDIQSIPDAILEGQHKSSGRNTAPSTPMLGRTPAKQRRQEQDDREWLQRDKEDTSIELQNKGNGFSVFISYVEIYNNYIYDLLDESIEHCRNTNRQPQSKMLREDARKRIYVNSATEVEIASADEGFEVFNKGIRRRRMAQTALNTDSSRSHSVFTIRVVQAPMNADGEVDPDPDHVAISQLHIVDLAGSERMNRTQTTGERQREAGNINNSLMALRNCIEILRENQKNNSSKIVPYRDNKLTHLFKNYFEGEGKVRMIICVNPSRDDYQETLHVMKFAEISQEVLVNRCNGELFRNDAGYGYNVISLGTAGALGPSLPSIVFANDPNDEKVIPEWLECLQERRKITQAKHKELQDRQLRFRAQLLEIEKENMLLKQEAQALRMDLNAREHQIKLFESQCAQRERANETHEKKVATLEKKVKQLERTMSEKDTVIAQHHIEMERLKQRFAEQLRHEQGRIQRIYEREMAEKESRLNREKCINEEKIARCHEILCAETSNWISMNDQHVTGRCGSPPPNSASGSSSLPAKDNNQEITPRSQLTPSKVRSKSKSADARLRSRRSEYDVIVRTEIYEDENGHPPVANPRHRRSLSTGNEKWIDHRPPGTLDLGTVFQPNMRNKKSVSNLKKVSTSDLKSASKYALTHHTTDQMGNVETEVYKGEIIPSAGGGAQVIFNDVETLKQGSPPTRKRTVSVGGSVSPGLVGTSTPLLDEPDHGLTPVSTKRSRR